MNKTQFEAKVQLSRRMAAEFVDGLFMSVEAVSEFRLEALADEIRELDREILRERQLAGLWVEA